MSTLRQTSFAAGELSPRLWGRTDLELWAHGLRTLRNAFVSPEGAAVSRPGTAAFVAGAYPAIVLLPFVYDDTTAYVLELGQFYLRVHHPDTGYTGVQLTTPYRSEDLPKLQAAQAGAVLTLTHPSYPPKEVQAPIRTLLGMSVWRFTDAWFQPTDFVTEAALQAFFYKPDGSAGTLPMVNAGTNPAALFVLDSSHPAREWKWKVATLARNVLTGQVAESLPRDVTQYFDGTTSSSVTNLPADNLVVLYPDAPVKLSHPAFGTAVPAPNGWVHEGLVWYRGRGSLFGFVGTTRYAQAFVDVGDAPDYARQPLRGTNPFVANPYNPTYPAAATYFQQRRVYGRQATVFLSATDAWANFDRPFPPYLPDDAAMEFDVYARRRESMRSLVAHRRLLCFTDSSAWSLGGADGAVTPTSAEVRLEDEVGATELQPLVVDGAVLYVSAKGRGVRALTLTDGGAYAAQDVSWHAEHLFRGNYDYIVSWCYQREPWRVIWAVTANGDLLSCTRTGASTWAWAKHSSGGDLVMSVATVPRTRHDEVFVAVRRGSTSYIEKMCVRHRETTVPLSNTDGDGDAAFALDAYINLACGVDVPFVMPTPDLAHLEGRDVWAVAPGNAPQGPLRVVGGKVTVGPFPTANLASGQVRVSVGLPFTCDVELLDAVQAGRLAQKTVVSVGFEVDSAQGLEVGEDFSHLVEWQQRAVADSYEYPSAAAVLAKVMVKGAWRKTARAALRQAKPLPFTLLGVTRELDGGGT